MSPDSPEPDSDYNLTPRTEAKYNKIDEDFQLMIARSQIPNVQRGMPGSNYTLPVSVPVGGSYTDSPQLQASPQMAHAISPRPPSSEPGGCFFFYIFFIYNFESNGSNGCLQSGKVRYKEEACYIYHFITYIR